MAEVRGACVGAEEEGAYRLEGSRLAICKTGCGRGRGRLTSHELEGLGLGLLVRHGV